jgi:hypothetical protein
LISSSTEGSLFSWPSVGSIAVLAKLNTFALVGIDAVPVEVEVDVSAGLPKTVIL